MIVLFFGYSLLRGIPSSSGKLPPAPSMISFTDALTAWMALLGLMVSVASLIVTGAGIIIAILAIFGYGTFKDEVRNRAGEAAREAAEEYFKGKAFEDKLKMSVSPTWESGTVAAGGIAAQGGEVAKRYPKGEQPK
jgi:hypothetical protein